MSRYIKIYPNPDDPEVVLIYSTLRGAVIQVARNVAESLVNGTLDWAESEDMARLGILVPSAEAEQRQVAEYFERANTNARCFTALVTLNLDCNLAAATAMWIIFADVAT